MIDPSFKKSNILIVDDQEANIDVLEGFLEMQGYVNIKSTTDPREVVALYERFQPDLILLDLSMPYLSGFEVMALLKKIVQPNTFLPILVLTADITSEAKINALSGGASDFLTKPFDLLEVGLRIKNLLFSSYLQQQLQNQNKVLDERVNERTRELTEKNAELQIAKEKAEASDKLKTAFINNISHEIRTPLNGILGFGQILTDPDLSEEEKHRYLYILNESSERLINTVTNFLEISMIASGNQNVNKNDFTPELVINDIVKQFIPVCLDKKLELNTDIPNTRGDKIYSDKELLFKILKHLTDNAVKFTNKGHITIGYFKEEHRYLFFVKDSGKGISEEGKRLIFKSFMQEDNSYTRGYEGCGLGLSIAKGLVELLDGELWVESVKGNGSTFFFTIPIQQLERESGSVLNINKLPGSLKTILVAEDDEINFVYINILLKSELVSVLHAMDGWEAIEICKEHPEIDAVLIDLKMPMLDGFEATKKIKAMRPDLPVLAITAYSGNLDRLRAQSSGCEEFITKPVRKEHLVEVLLKYGIQI